MCASWCCECWRAQCDVTPDLALLHAHWPEWKFNCIVLLYINVKHFVFTILSLMLLHTNLNGWRAARVNQIMYNNTQQKDKTYVCKPNCLVERKGLSFISPNFELNVKWYCHSMPWLCTQNSNVIKEIALPLTLFPA